MKTFRYISFFILLMCLSFFVVNHDNHLLGQAVNRKVELNDSLDSAIDAAVVGIVQSADGNTVEIDFEQCIDNFYRDLFASFGVMDSYSLQEKLKLYTPVLAIADTDGLYVYYSDIIQDKVVQVWSQKMPYTYHGVAKDQLDSYSYTLNFTMGDEISIIIEGFDTVFTGHLAELGKKYPNNTDEGVALQAVLSDEVLQSSGSFQAWKNQTITSTIMEKLNYYVNRHNRIAEVYGEQFSFSLPISAESDIARNITDVSFMCFFQGYPLANGTSEVYSQFEISGARVTKTNGYFTQVVDNYLYYHRLTCGRGSGSRKWYATMDECAQEGALPCPYCKP